MSIERHKPDPREEGHHIGWPAILLGIAVFLAIWFILQSSPTAPLP